MSGGVDAHVHLWTRQTDPQPWIDPVAHAPIDRDFTPDDLAVALGRAGQSRAVVVQSSNSLPETMRLLAISHPAVCGVVGWLDLATRLDDAIASAKEAATTPLVGVRHLAHIDPDPQWLVRSDVGRGLDSLAAHDLAYDLVVRWWQLPQAAQIAAHHPGLTLVLDHLGGPPMDEDSLYGWQVGLEELSTFDNVVAKVSGVPSALARDSWTLADIRPVLDAAMETFGPDRLMYGSDWPLVLLGGGENRWRTAVDDYLAQASAAERDSINFGCAERAYRLEPSA